MSRAKLEIPEVRRALSRHHVGHRLMQAAEHHVGQHVADGRPRHHRARVWCVDDRILRRGHGDRVQGTGIIGNFRRDDAFHAKGGIGLRVAHRAVDTEIRSAGSPFIVDMDNAVGNRQLRDEINRRFHAVDAHGMRPTALRQLVDRGCNCGLTLLDDVPAKRIEIVEIVLVHHREKPLCAGFVTSSKRVNVAFDLHRFADVGAHHVEEPLVHLAFGGERHDWDVQPFMIDLPTVRRHPDAADIDDMASAGEHRYHAAIAERRCHDGKIMQMAGALPWIVGEVNVPFLHRVRREHVEEMNDRARHRVDMPRCPGDRLRQHLTLEIEDTGRNITGFPR